MRRQPSKPYYNRAGHTLFSQKIHLEHGGSRFLSEYAPPLAASLANPELGTPYSKNKAMGLVFQRVTIEGRRGDYRLDFELSPLFEDVAHYA